MADAALKGNYILEIRGEDPMLPASIKNLQPHNVDITSGQKNMSDSVGIEAGSGRGFGIWWHKLSDDNGTVYWELSSNNEGGRFVLYSSKGRQINNVNPFWVFLYVVLVLLIVGIYCLAKWKTENVQKALIRKILLWINLTVFNLLIWVRFLCIIQFYIAGKMK